MRNSKGVAAARTGGGDRPLCPLILRKCLPRDPAAIIQVLPITGKVGRTKRIGMADLRALVERLGHESVKTHLQGGNVIFESPKRSAKPLESAMEKAIASELGMDVTVIVRRSDELAKIAAGSPFEG